MNTDILFKVTENAATSEYAEFVIEPLESGYGHTLGAALRRVLLTSMPGVAVTAVKINGVKHRFSEIPGLKENVIDFLLNIKGLHFHLPESQSSATVKISVKGAGEITGNDVEESNGVEVINKDHYLGSLSGDKAKFDAELTIERGYGYSLAEDRHIDTLGVIPTDAVFSPVQRVNYFIEATRVGRRTDLDKLIVKVWTTGSITPRESLDEAAKLLASYFTQIYQPKDSSAPEAALPTPNVSDEVLKMTVDELDLPTRIYNSLRNGGIETLQQLLATARKDLINMRNMGVKSISIIEDKLKEKGISLPA